MRNIIASVALLVLATLFACSRPDSSAGVALQPNQRSSQSSASWSDSGELDPTQSRESQGSLHELLRGAVIIAADGQVLGKIIKKFDEDSIANEFGRYGSEFEERSMFNQFGDYGSEFGIYSPFNPYCPEPPLLYVDSEPVAVVTIQDHVPSAVHPNLLRRIAAEMIGK